MSAEPTTGETSTWRATALDDALVTGQNVVFSASRPFTFAPRFAPPFPVRAQGVLFAREGAAALRDRVTLPCFGLFHDVPLDVLAACALNVTVLSAEAADRFAIELAHEGDPDTRLLIGRGPRGATLRATIEPLIAAAKRGPTWWDRVRGMSRFTSDEALKVPPIHVQIDGVTFHLASEGAPIPPGERTTGRGEVYRRAFVCDGPFSIVLLGKSSGEVILAARVEDAA